MKSRISLLRRAITLILALVFLAGPMASPASEVRADEEFSFDESTFKDPEYTTSMMYYWHTGLPAVQKDNANREQFGTERMLEALNAVKNETPQGVLKGVRRSVDGFVQQAEQFDDLTMLCVEYRGHEEAKAE